MIDVVNYGNIRGISPINYPEGVDEQLQLNNRGYILTAQGLPTLSELTRLGNSYVARTTTAVAPVIDIPTTAYLIAIWNGELDNGKSYIIDSVFALTVASTAAQQASTILINVSTQQSLTALANTITPRSLKANQPYRGRARIAVNTTTNATDGVAANWFPAGTTPEPIAGATNNIGSCTDIDLKGMIIIPPKGILCVSVLSAATTASSVQVGLRWHEVQLVVN